MFHRPTLPKGNNLNIYIHASTPVCFYLKMTSVSKTFMIFKTFRPRLLVVGYFGKRRLFSPNTATVHAYPAFSGTRNGGFQKRSPGWRVLKTEIHRICVDGRKRRLSNTMMSCLSLRLALLHTRFKNTTCGYRYFLIWRKKPPFSKIPGYAWTVKYDSETLHVNAALTVLAF